MINETTDVKGLDALPTGSRLFVCGAGGKTSLIRELAARYRGRGMRTAVTTSTHMLAEDGLCLCGEEVRAALLREGYAFFGLPDPKKPGKIMAPDREMLAAAIAYADVLLVEADGARRMPFKVPYPHEPVIWECATHLALVYGLAASGRRIREAAYNAEGCADVLGLSVDDVLTEERMKCALEKTYGVLFRERFPSLPVTCLAL